MDLPTMKNDVKKIALDSGAVLAGVGSRDRLAMAPPSADMHYCLQGAQSCMIWAYAVPFEVLKNYFGKVERLSMKRFDHYAYTTGWMTAVRIARYIEDNSAFKALPVAPNGDAGASAAKTSPSIIYWIRREQFRLSRCATAQWLRALDTWGGPATS
jgi:hypothetical protein